MNENYIYLLMAFLIINLLLALLVSTWLMTLSVNSQIKSDGMAITNGTACQYTDMAKIPIFNMQMYCTLNATRAVCSNMGGTQLPFFTNYSYLTWPQCTPAQNAIIAEPNSINVIDM